jgi:predicted RNase H-like nuclease
MSVLGVDWARRGWVAVALADGAPPRVLFAERLQELLHREAAATHVGVDMPIGLPERGVRTSDLEARAFVGRRRASVFLAPPRAVLDAPDYAAANVVAEELLDGARISQQAWGLRHTILEVEAIDDPRLHEVHPEASFRALAGGDLAHAKTTWNGQMARRAALAAAGIVLPDDVGAEAGRVPPADVLDAAAVAWTARRLAAGEAIRLGGPVGAIWY